MIVSIDAGNSETKYCSQYGVGKFPSVLGEFRERRLEQNFGDSDMVYEYKGKKGFAGTLAKYESEFAGSVMGDTKAHEDAKIRILLALYMIGEAEYQIVTGQPIGKHVPEEKLAIKAMLLGKHSISVNGVAMSFVVSNAEVAAEGGAAFWADPQDGLIRILDIGSGTVNGATLCDSRYIDKDSFTISFGADTNISNDMEALTRGIATQALKKWNRNDKVLIAGGIAKGITPYIQKFFPSAEIIKPSLRGQILHPVYANAVGFYQIARGVYGDY